MRMKLTAAFALLFAAAAWAAIEIIPPPAIHPPGPAASGDAPASPQQDPAAPAVPAGAGVLELLNGDRMTGTWERMDTSAGLISFRHESLREPADVATIGLRRFKASRRENGAQTPASNWAVTLTNGDLLRGEMVALDDQTLELDTWYSGRVKIARALIQSARHTSAMGTIFEGPGNPEGWTNTHGSPRIFNEDIHLNDDIIGRQLDRMPPKSRIDFELKWFAKCAFLFTFYSDQTTTHVGTNHCYEFALQDNNRITLYHIIPMSANRRIGQANLQGLESINDQYAARFSIFTDLEQKKILVYVNGAQVADWTDFQGFDGKGKAIVFCSCMGSPPIIVRNIRVSEWDGRTPDSGKEAPAVGTAETLSLNDGDHISGALKALSGETACVETSFGVQEISVDRIYLITFAKNDARARRNRDDMRLALWDDTIITLGSARLAEEVVEGSSDNTGSIRLPLSGVRSAEWNLYGQREPEEKQEDKSGTDMMLHITRGG
ncbi:MAG: hypothetical protein KBA51_00780 [Kiritimatiellae bacterium]|nr:hypothetical protein [Kiritimatiellia bacterium]